MEQNPGAWAEVERSVWGSVHRYCLDDVTHVYCAIPCAALKRRDLRLQCALSWLDIGFRDWKLEDDFPSWATEIFGLDDEESIKRAAIMEAKCAVRALLAALEAAPEKVKHARD